jgi:hypothetical protein
VTKSTKEVSGNPLNAVTSEAGGKPELIPCSACSRPNPLTRTSCIYCGAELDLNDEQRASLRPVIRKVESYEPGFSLIYVPGDGEATGSPAADVAGMLRLEEDAAVEVLGSTFPVPLARAATENEASVVRESLEGYGVEIVVVADDELVLNTPPARLRGLEFCAGEVRPVLFNPAEGDARAAAVELAVSGTIVKREVSSSEKKAKGGEHRILDSAEIGSDEKVLDIYLAGDTLGYRIRANGFDFSCLGAAKRLLAAENLPLLEEKLKEEFPGARFVDSYSRARKFLVHAWPPEEVSSSEGFERKNFGGYARLRTLSTDNEPQFNRYSRLQRILLAQGIPATKG